MNRVDNLYVSGMMITSNHNAHMSTKNTVSCMGQGQASSTVAALRTLGNCTSRQLPYVKLKKAQEVGGVYFEK